MSIYGEIIHRISERQTETETQQYRDREEERGKDLLRICLKIEISCL